MSRLVSSNNSVCKTESKSRSASALRASNGAETTRRRRRLLSVRSVRGVEGAFGDCATLGVVNENLRSVRVPARIGINLFLWGAEFSILVSRIISTPVNCTRGHPIPSSSYYIPIQIEFTYRSAVESLLVRVSVGADAERAKIGGKFSLDSVIPESLEAGEHEC